MQSTSLTPAPPSELIRPSLHNHPPAFVGDMIANSANTGLSVVTHEHLRAWEELKAALVKTNSVFDVVKIRAQAEAIRYALQVAKESPDVVRKAMEIKLRAERRAGEILMSRPKQRPGQYRKSNGNTPTPIPLSYEEEGIDKTKAAQWQQSASLPAEKFEAYLRSGEECSSAGVSRLARAHRAGMDSHERTKERQARNDDSVHHPIEKIDQIRQFLPQREIPYKILELFSGGREGNLTPIYKEYGEVEVFDKK